MSGLSRRFVYLVTNDGMSRDYLLRRIDMSRFFLPRTTKRFAPALEQGRLPPVAQKFSTPVSEICNGSMSFMLLAGLDVRRNDKVVATDETGRTLLYDAKLGSVRTLTALTAPKLAPISLSVGNNLYILDVLLSGGKYDHCFDGLIYHGGGYDSSQPIDWHCHSLPPPPYLHSYGPEDGAHVISYGWFGDSKIWISKHTLGTHSFDVDSGVWTKAGDWVLPFYGQFHHVPELNLWFGLDCAEEGSVICSSDLNMTPPTTTRTVWEDLTPPDWKIATSGGRPSYLVHLGNSKFCHARFFYTMHPKTLPDEETFSQFVVFTGLEVKGGKDGLQPYIVKHRSVLFSLIYGLMKWVL